MSGPVLFGEVVDADVKELRDIAQWFDRRGDKDNGDFLRAVAARHEILSGAYSTSSRVRDAAFEFFCWFNRTYKNPGGNETHEWNVLADALGASEDRVIEHADR